LLSEFGRVFAGVPDRGGDHWRLSALVGPNIREEMGAIAQFNDGFKSGSGTRALVDIVEVKAATTAEIQGIGIEIPRSLLVHVEIPLDPAPAPLIGAIRSAGLRAKVRTGGVTMDSFPSSGSLARFIHACAKEGVAFKATAGLHHPLRGQYRLTYEPGSHSGTMFGFLNVLIAAALAFQGEGMSGIVDVLEERSASGFHFSDSEISWRGRHADLGLISSIRNDFAVSFGSCSFTEPFEDLQSLGLP